MGKSIKTVWISHPHADHFLGIIRFLNERNKIINNGDRSDDDRIVLIAPRNCLLFLAEYQRLDPTIQDGYIPIDCADILPGKVNPVGTRLYELLEITHISAVHVAHCFHSYGVVVDSTAFGRVVYSGDCRPSERL